MYVGSKLTFGKIMSVKYAGKLIPCMCMYCVELCVTIYLGEADEDKH